MTHIRSRAGIVALLVATIGRAGLAQDVSTSAEPDTRLQLGDDSSIVLPGCWTERKVLWEDSALVFYDQYAWWSLDGGAGSPRLLHRYPDRSWSRSSAPTWSQDGRQLLAWLELDRQLTSVDVVDGTMRSLSELPTHVWSMEGRKHMDPRPIWRAGGVVIEPGSGLLLQLLQEESNEEVAAWQRSSTRSGAHSLVAFDPDLGTMTPVSTVAMPGKVLSWDLSPRRQRLFTLDISQQLLECRLNGQVVRHFDFWERRAQRIQLSPDERTLLVESSATPGVAGTTGDQGGGYVLLDLEEGTSRTGATAGRLAAWSPDGKWIACLRPWEIWVCDVHTGESVRVARREMPPVGQPLPMYYERPVWSADSRRLAAGLGGRVDSPTLLLDLESREAFVLRSGAEDAVWSTESHPFPKGWVSSSG